MSERKVQNKYYPPDYDPSKVPRVKRKNKQKDVRMMAPVTMQCNTCHEYIAPGKKFNAKKETVADQTYNDLFIFRFYIRCPTCMATITFRTDIKEKCYKVEQGATENFTNLKNAEKEAREQAEAEEEEEKIDPMKQLEKRTKASRQQMEASEQIRSIRSMKYQMNSIDIDSVIKSKQEEASKESVLSITNERRDEDDEIRAEAKRMMKRKNLETSGITSSSQETKSNLKLEAHSSGRKMLHSSLSSLKKKIKVVPKSTTS